MAAVIVKCQEHRVKITIVFFFFFIAELFFGVAHHHLMNVWDVHNFPLVTKPI